MSKDRSREKAEVHAESFFQQEQPMPHAVHREEWPNSLGRGWWNGHICFKTHNMKFKMASSQFTKEEGGYDGFFRP
jgi:hypothetical protein